MVTVWIDGCVVTRTTCVYNYIKLGCLILKYCISNTFCEDWKLLQHNTDSITYMADHHTPFSIFVPGLRVVKNIM